MPRPSGHRPRVVDPGQLRTDVCWLLSYTATVGPGRADAVRDDLPRWIRRLEERAITEIPGVATRDNWKRPDYARACNELNLLLGEEAPATAHRCSSTNRCKSSIKPALIASAARTGPPTLMSFVFDSVIRRRSPKRGGRDPVAPLRSKRRPVHPAHNDHDPRRQLHLKSPRSSI